MKTQKKRTNHLLSSLVKKLTISLYIFVAVLSIMHHNINNIGNLVVELIVYSSFGIWLNMVIKNISIKNIKEGLRILFY